MRRRPLIPKNRAAAPRITAIIIGGGMRILYSDFLPFHVFLPGVADDRQRGMVLRPFFGISGRPAADMISPIRGKSAFLIFSTKRGKSIEKCRTLLYNRVAQLFYYRKAAFSFAPFLFTCGFLFGTNPGSGRGIFPADMELLNDNRDLRFRCADFGWRTFLWDRREPESAPYVHRHYLIRRNRNEKDRYASSLHLPRPPDCIRARLLTVTPTYLWERPDHAIMYYTRHNIMVGIQVENQTTHEPVKYLDYYTEVNAAVGEPLKLIIGIEGYLSENGIKENADWQYVFNIKLLDNVYTELVPQGELKFVDESDN